MIKVKYLNKATKKYYLDKSEKFLLKFFDKPESKKKKEIIKILQANPSWQLLYNLSPQRRHLVDWYPFNKKETLLDIGAGSGSLTGVFCEKLKKVTCLELTPARAKIIAKRWSDKTNIEVICGSIEDFNTRERFDYINLTGVLEYAGRYAKDLHSSENFLKMPLVFIKKAKRLLKKGGKLLVAIENPLGIRYLTGAVEDHTAELFESVENFPQYSGARTFTKEELKALLLDQGFSNIEYYYPIPDYKLPWLVINEEYLDNLNSNSLSSLLKTVEYDHYPKFDVFTESPFAHQLAKEKLLSSFMNSFFVVAQKR